ncbi:MAG: presqualene diphosphate synthase HpnD [Candidatus Omnitrophica bacterium]|nr:presqualene diphosphate synthase HpnD [Candidatus Omnitrophota bacterium]
MPSFRDYCRWLTRASGSHFALGIRLLPVQKREAMEAVYAYCRAVDDAVDGNSDPALARRELSLWRGQIASLENGFPVHPIAVALQRVLRRYQIPARHFEDLLQGMEMDLTRRRYATFEELRVYCEHVASVVGLISIGVFGCERPASGAYARNLGIALQMTNILRDLKSDAGRGRIYLPQEELRFGVSEEEILEGKRSESFRRLMAFQCQRAKEFFRRAQESLEESGEKGKLLPARLMGAVYGALLTQIERSNYDVYARPIKVAPARQAWIAAKVLVGAG